MKQNQRVLFQICKSGVLTALAIVFGTFIHFPLLGGHIFLVGAIVFIFPMFLKWPFSLLSAIISVSLVDVFSGWSNYFWISAIAYGVSVIIIELFTLLKWKIFYLLGVLTASFLNVGIYYLLEQIVFGKELAIQHIVVNIIQFAIVFGIVSLVYFPLKLLSKII